MKGTLQIMASYQSDTAPYIVGASCLAVVVVVLIWYTFVRLKVHKALKKSEQKKTRTHTRKTAQEGINE